MSSSSDERRHFGNQKGGKTFGVAFLLSLASFRSDGTKGKPRRFERRDGGPLDT